MNQYIEPEIEEAACAAESDRAKHGSRGEKKNGTPDPEALGAIMAAWRAQAGTPSRAEQAKQGAAAKRVASAHPADRIEAALEGLPQLFPYSDGTPWDCFDLERVFSKAAARGEQERPTRERELTARQFFAREDARARRKASAAAGRST